MSFQSGITGLGTTDHVFLELDLKTATNTAAAETCGCPHAAGQTAEQAAGQSVAQLATEEQATAQQATAQRSSTEKASASDAVSALIDAVNLPSTSGVNVVLGFRPSLWESIAEDGDAPENVHDFSEAITGPSFSMPATQHDAWVWVQGSSRSQAFECASTILRDAGDYFTLSKEVTGWVYQHNRDLTGFEDGTENPPALEAPGVVAVPHGKPGAGSSVVLFQLWEHLSEQWEALSDSAQECVIGRTKQDSVELDDDVNPESSHVNRTVVERDGEELEIFRRNVSYGDISNHGTVFVGFSFDQWRMEEMLRRMAGSPNEPSDRLADFTTPLTGAWYVCPSPEALLRVAE